MKANHNGSQFVTGLPDGVVNISYSKNESKSQHLDEGLEDIARCCKYQLFKE